MHGATDSGAAYARRRTLRSPVRSASAVCTMLLCAPTMMAKNAVATMTKWMGISTKFGTTNTAPTIIYDTRKINSIVQHTQSHPTRTVPRSRAPLRADAAPCFVRAGGRACYLAGWCGGACVLCTRRCCTTQTVQCSACSAQPGRCDGATCDGAPVRSVRVGNGRPYK